MHNSKALFNISVRDRILQDKHFVTKTKIAETFIKSLSTITNKNERIFVSIYIHNLIHV